MKYPPDSPNKPAKEYHGEILQLILQHGQLSAAYRCAVTFLGTSNVAVKEFAHEEFLQYLSVSLDSSLSSKPRKSTIEKSDELLTVTFISFFEKFNARIDSLQNELHRYKTVKDKYNEKEKIRNSRAVADIKHELDEIRKEIAEILSNEYSSLDDEINSAIGKIVSELSNLSSLEKEVGKVLKDCEAYAEAKGKTTIDKIRLILTISGIFISIVLAFIFGKNV